MNRMTATVAVLGAVTVFVSSAASQQPDYRRADVIRTAVSPSGLSRGFLDDSVRFWYKSPSGDDRGVTYLVDPRTAARTLLFDNDRMAAALSAIADSTISPSTLPGFTVRDTGKAIQAMVRRRSVRCTTGDYVCGPTDTAANPRTSVRSLAASRSPDGQWDVFGYNYNLYARPARLADYKQLLNTDSIALPHGSVALTNDGSALQPYSGAGTLRRWQPRMVAPRWSPDSRRFVVSRSDTRGVRRYPLYSSTGTTPTDRSYAYAAVGDSIIPVYDTYIVTLGDSANVRSVRVDLPAVASESNTRLNWSGDSRRLFLIHTTRGNKSMAIVAADAETGKATTITRDSFPSWVEFRPFVVVNGGEDLLWISERDGWAHIYRYGADGRLKNQVEAGEYAVREIVRVDSTARRIYFTARGREPGVPYYAYLYGVDFDGRNLKLLTPERGNHEVTFVAGSGYFIDARSGVGVAPIITLRSASSGKAVMTLGHINDAGLSAVGWTPPEAFTVKARDGKTDLYGLMFKPSHFDSTKRYPIIAHVYPGPGGASVFGWAFDARQDQRALAELGFIVIELNSLGTPGRSKAFNDYFYGDMGDNGIPDQVAGIKQLAQRHRWIDVDRVGIYGHSGGGFASTAAMLRYPDFFKVAVSSAGNHDNRTYGYFWGERYQGLLQKDSAGGDNYESSANYKLAANLKGKLLLMHGDLDSNVHPANTLRLVDALIKANKDFDMIIVPDAGHNLPDYAVRKRWDFFVRHLLGVEPPSGYKMLPRPNSVSANQ